MGLNRYVARQFSNPKGLGGKLVSVIMNRQNRPLYEATAGLLLPSDDDSILDIGCGNGYVLNMLAHRYVCTFTGIDASSSIIKSACKRNRKFIKSGNMTLMCQNAKDMPFVGETFSKVYTINTVYFWENLKNTMTEINRILKPDGLFINTLYSNEILSRFSHTQFGYKRFTPQQLLSAGNETGFNTKIEPILNGKAYCIIYRKHNLKI